MFAKFTMTNGLVGRIRIDAIDAYGPLRSRTVTGSWIRTRGCPTDDDTIDVTATVDELDALFGLKD